MMRKFLVKNYLIFIALFIFVFLLITATRNGDFKVFLEASKLMMAGEQVYNNWIYVSEGNYCLYYYSPLWAVILMPFTFLPPFITNLIWLSLNVYFLFRIGKLLFSYLDQKSLSRRTINLILLISILMSFRFVLYNFGMIQMTIFMLWGCLESVRLINEEKIILGSILLALIINVKILPVVLLPYLFYRNAYKAAIGTIFLLVLFLFVPSVIVGWQENIHLLTEWWKIINPLNDEHLLETELGPHSLTALIPTLLSSTEGILPYSRNILNLNHETAILILNSIRLIMVLMTLYFLRWPPFKKSESNILQLRELSYLLLLIPLIFPHQQKYAFALGLPAMFYLAYYTISYRNNVSNKRWLAVVSLMCISFLLMTLTTDSLVGRDFNKIMQHYKTITWGALLLIPALIIAVPIKYEHTVSSEK